MCNRKESPGTFTGSHRPACRQAGEAQGSTEIHRAGQYKIEVMIKNLSLIFISPAGSGGSLEVVFDTSARNGIQSKTVSVKSNSKTEVVILKITAEVISRQ